MPDIYIRSIFGVLVFSQDKNALNVAQHGLDFRLVPELIAGGFKPTQSVQNGETRWMLFGYLKGKPTAAVLVVTKEGHYRPISLRPASRQERRKHYGQD